MDTGNGMAGRMAEVLRTQGVLLEARRKKFRVFLALGAALIVCGTAAWVLLDPLAHGDGEIVATVFAALLPSVIYYNILNHFYRRGGKALFMEGFCAATGFRFDSGGMFSLDDVMKHKIIPPAHTHRIGDGLAGGSKGIDFEIQEVEMNDVERDTRDRRRRRDVQIFRGFFIRLRVPKPFEGHTVIMPDNALLTWFRTRFSEFQKINLVAPKFEKRYDVMGTDQVEGRVIMNPAFIERFMDAGDILKARYMEVSFLGGEILITVARTRPLFAFDPLWQKVTVERLKRLTGDVEAVLRVIDALKLNRQITG